MNPKLKITFAAIGFTFFGSVSLAQSLKPIKVGAVSSSAFPEASQAAKAHFDVINASGGVNGRKIEYLSLLEGENPVQAASSASHLINDLDVVALVGGSGLLDCPINAKSYAAANLMSLQGASVAADCFRSSNIVPVNNGPYIGLENAINFAYTQLKGQKICVSLLDLPGMVPAYRELLERDAKRYPRPLASVQTIPPNGSIKPFIKIQLDQGCNTIIFTGHEPAVINWIETSSQMDLKEVDWVFLTPAYTATVAKVAKVANSRVYAMAEFEPWQSSTFAIGDWKRLMLKNKLPLSSLSQGGYVAAQLFVRTIREIKGPIDRDRFSKALREMKPQNHAFLGMAFESSQKNAHAPNRTSLPMMAHDGFWRIAWPQWIEALPPKIR